MVKNIDNKLKPIYDIELATEAQMGFCSSKKVPLFAPVYGVCPSCKGNIYQVISVEEASNDLITGCPYCNESFVE